MSATTTSPVVGAVAVEATGIEKRFGSTRALRGVDLRLEAGQCLGLVGRNGAGKSTLVSILSGLVAPDAGQVRFGGQPAPKARDVDAWRERIATVFQHSMVVPALTVAENVFLGNWITTRGSVDWKAMRQRTRDIVDDWGFEISPNALCADLTVEQLQIVEIARALATGAPCVLLDEPTAALERAGVARLFERVTQLVERGVAVLYISHHLEEVFEVCRDVTVLRDGEVVLNSAVADITKDGIVAAMVGDAEKAAGSFTAPDEVRPAEDAPTSTRLVLDDVWADSSQGSLRGVSLQIRAGERVGVTGLISAGVATLGRVVAGADGYKSGQVMIDGRPLASGRRDRSLRAGVGYIPGDRQVDGFVGVLGVAENTTMTITDRLAARFGWFTPRRRDRAARPLNEALSLVSSGPGQPVRELSGGNQQKVTVGRALIRDPGVIVAITPTRGVDVASKALLLDALSTTARETGAALLLASDELDDLVQCDRVVVLVRGEVFTEFTGPSFDREQLIAATEGLRTATTTATAATESGSPMGVTAP